MQSRRPKNNNGAAACCLPATLRCRAKIDAALAPLNLKCIVRVWDGEGSAGPNVNHGL